MSHATVHFFILSIPICEAEVSKRDSVFLAQRDTVSRLAEANHKGGEGVENMVNPPSRAVGVSGNRTGQDRKLY